MQHKNSQTTTGNNASITLGGNSRQIPRIISEEPGRQMYDALLGLKTGIPVLLDHTRQQRLSSGGFANRYTPR